MPKPLKWVLRGFGGLLLGLVLLVLAWGLSNSPLADSAPRPRPAELEVHVRDIPAERNGFFIQIGLLAPSGEDPAVAGQRLWIAQHYAPGSGGLALPAGDLWDCDKGNEECTGLWFRRSSDMAHELAVHAEFVRRCVMLADAPDYEERLIPWGDGTHLELPQYKTVMACNRVLRASLVLAAGRGQSAAALQAFDRADRLARLQLTGCHSLIGQAIAWAAARRNAQTAAALAAQHPELASALLARLPPLPPEVLSAAPWIAFESGFGQATIDGMEAGCRRAIARKQFDAAADRLWCEYRIGLLPNATKQALDQQWLAIRAVADRGMPAALQADASLPDLVPPWAYLHWRNSIGGVLVDVARPQYAQYLAKQADVELLRTAAALALRMSVEHVDAARRQTWLDAQSLPAPLRARLSLDAGALSVKPWLADVPGAAAGPSPQIRLPLAS